MLDMEDNFVKVKVTLVMCSVLADCVDGDVVIFTRVMDGLKAPLIVRLARVNLKVN